MASGGYDLIVASPLPWNSPIWAADDDTTIAALAATGGTVVAPAGTPRPLRKAKRSWNCVARYLDETTKRRCDADEVGLCLNPWADEAVLVVTEGNHVADVNDKICPDEEPVPA